MLDRPPGEAGFLVRNAVKPAFSGHGDNLGTVGSLAVEE
jgi:hypothetical protein